MKLKYFIYVFMACVLLFSAQASDDGLLPIEDKAQTYIKHPSGDLDFDAKLAKSFEDFREGNYSESAPILKKGCEKRHPIALEYYADICHKKRDGCPHTYSETAMYYIAAAFSGHTDIYSWLASIDDRIVSENGQIEDQICILVRHWERKEFDDHYQEIDTIDLIHYIAYCGGELGKTKCQKAPYFYSLALQAMRFFSIVDPNIQNASNAKPAPQVLKTCREELINRKLCYEFEFAPWVGGITEPSSFDDLAQLFGEYEENGTTKRLHTLLPSPKEKPQLGLLREWIADSIQSFMDTRNATCISKLTHRSLPWLIAGLQYAEEQIYNPNLLPEGIKSSENLQRIFDNPQAQLQDDQLETLIDIIDKKVAWTKNRKKKIEQFKHGSHQWLIMGLQFWEEQSYDLNFLPEDIKGSKDLQDILNDPQAQLREEQWSALIDIAETKVFWTQEREGKIVKQFQDNLYKEFFSDRAVYSDVVTELLKPILKRARKIKVDIETDEGRDCLKTGFVLQFCEDITLCQLQSNKITYEHLFNACSHLGFLKTMTIQFSKTFDQENEWGEKIFGIILYFQSKGVGIKFKE